VCLWAPIFSSPWLKPGVSENGGIDEQKPGKTMHFVSIDDVHGAQLAVEHLIASWHHRIGYVGVTNHAKSNQYRLKGYQDALAAAGIASDPALIFTSNHIKDDVKKIGTAI
jgi:DNA-binding LacI/PurR family transcriptional regulator